MVEIEYVDPTPDVPAEPAEQMLEIVQNQDPMKPWTLVKRVNDEFPDYEHDELRLQVLKPLTLEGVFMPNADGDIITYKPDRLSNIVDA